MPSVSDQRPGGPRLLYVATSKNDGGLERYSAALARRLHERGESVHFACRPGEIVETLCHQSGVATLPLTTRNSADPDTARRLAQQIAAHRIDIVHVHSRRDYVPAVLGVAQARRMLRAGGRRPRLVLHAHMLRPLGSPARLSGHFFRWGADLVLANSEAVRALLVRRHGFPPAFVRLLHNGVDLDAFALPGAAAADARQAQRRAWGLAPDAPVLGMVGRLDAKGQGELLAAAPALAARHPGLHIVLIGSEGEPETLRRLQAQATALGVMDRLVLTGPREDVPALLPALDVLVHLPRDESFGLALAEAMAAGLPTVATSIGGCREVVRDGLTGLLVPPGDAPALTAALEWFLDPAEGAARRTAFGEVGRRVVAENFSRERQLDLLQSLYGHLCPSPTL